MLDIFLKFFEDYNQRRLRNCGYNVVNRIGVVSKQTPNVLFIFFCVLCNYYFKDFKRINWYLQKDVVYSLLSGNIEDLYIASLSEELLKKHYWHLLCIMYELNYSSFGFLKKDMVKILSSNKGSSTSWEYIFNSLPYSDYILNVTRFSSTNRYNEVFGNTLGGYQQRLYGALLGESELETDLDYDIELLNREFKYVSRGLGDLPIFGEVNFTDNLAIPGRFELFDIYSKKYYYDAEDIFLMRLSYCYETKGRWTHFNEREIKDRNKLSWIRESIKEKDAIKSDIMENVLEGDYRERCEELDSIEMEQIDLEDFLNNTYCSSLKNRDIVVYLESQLEYKHFAGYSTIYPIEKISFGLFKELAYLYRLGLDFPREEISYESLISSYLDYGLIYRRYHDYMYYSMSDGWQGVLDKHECEELLLSFAHKVNMIEELDDDLELDDEDDIFSQIYYEPEDLFDDDVMFSYFNTWMYEEEWETSFKYESELNFDVFKIQEQKRFQLYGKSHKDKEQMYYYSRINSSNSTFSRNKRRLVYAFFSKLSLEKILYRFNKFEDFIRNVLMSFLSLVGKFLKSNFFKECLKPFQFIKKLYKRCYRFYDVGLYGFRYKYREWYIRKKARWILLFVSFDMRVVNKYFDDFVEMYRNQYRENSRPLFSKKKKKKSLYMHFEDDWYVTSLFFFQDLEDMTYFREKYSQTFEGISDEIEYSAEPFVITDYEWEDEFDLEEYHDDLEFEFPVDETNFDNVSEVDDWEDNFPLRKLDDTFDDDEYLAEIELEEYCLSSRVRTLFLITGEKFDLKDQVLELEKSEEE